MHTATGLSTGPAKMQTRTLPGVGRALVLAGRIDENTAQEIYDKALSAKRAFISELVESGTFSGIELAHTLSRMLAAH